MKIFIGIIICTFAYPTYASHQIHIAHATDTSPAQHSITKPHEIPLQELTQHNQQTDQPKAVRQTLTQPKALAKLQASFYQDNTELDGLLSQMFISNRLSAQELQTALFQNTQTLQTLIIPAIVHALQNLIAHDFITTYRQQLQIISDDITRLKAKQQHNLDMHSAYQNNIVRFVQATATFVKQAEERNISFTTLSAKLTSHMQVLATTAQECANLLDAQISEDNMQEKSKDISTRLKPFLDDIKNINHLLNNNIFFKELVHDGYTQKVKTLWRNFIDQTNENRSSLTINQDILKNGIYIKSVTLMFIIRLIAYAIPSIIHIIHLNQNKIHAATLHAGLHTSAFTSKNNATSNPTLAQFTQLHQDPALADQTQAEHEEVKYTEPTIEHQEKLIEILHTMLTREPTISESLEQLDNFLYTAATTIIPQILTNLQATQPRNSAQELLEKQIAEIISDITKLHTGYQQHAIAQPAEYANTAVAITKAVHLFASNISSQIPDEAIQKMLSLYHHTESISRLISHNNFEISSNNWQAISALLQQIVKPITAMQLVVNTEPVITALFGTQGTFAKMNKICTLAHADIHKTHQKKLNNLVDASATLYIIVAHTVYCTLIALPYLIGITSAQKYDVTVQNAHHATNTKSTNGVYLENRTTPYSQSKELLSKNQSVAQWNNLWESFEQPFVATAF